MNIPSKIHGLDHYLNAISCCILKRIKYMKIKDEKHLTTRQFPSFTIYDFHQFCEVNSCFINKQFCESICSEILVILQDEHII